MTRTFRLPLLLVCVALLAGCATAPRESGTAGVYDPLEPVNRRVHAFNEDFDRIIAKPVATAYQRVTPGLVDQAVTNFFNNLDDVVVLVNSVLQLKPGDALVTTHRLIVNSTVGVFGLIDVMGYMGAEKRNEDFGQTLGYWGVGNGPYIVLPLLGPSNLRDTTGFVVDSAYSPVGEIEPSGTRAAAIALRAVDTRADLLGATNVLETAAIDPYSFTREAFTRRRISLIHDGNPPPEAVPGSPESPGDDEFDAFSDDDDDLFDESPDATE